MSIEQEMTPRSAQDESLIAALTRNWLAEMEGAATYRALAEKETELYRRDILFKLADGEMAHAARWAARLSELGAPTPDYTGSPTGVADSVANRIGGPESALRRVELGERKHIAAYSRQLASLGDAGSEAILRDVIDDERGHSQTLRSMFAAPARDAQGRLDAILKREPHRSGGNWIGDAIYGVNDGLGAIFGIVSGVSGATSGQSHFVLIAGLAGMIASALSMGSGAYLAATSEHELSEAELHREQQEIEEDPDEELDEMTLFYQLKGVPEGEARQLAEHLQRTPAQFLRTMAHEELSLSQDNVPDPWRSALSGGVSTAVGAFIPVIPFFFLTGAPAIISAAVISLLGHFAVGAAKSLVTVRSWWSSGLQMTVVGVITGSITFLVGLALGAV